MLRFQVFQNSPVSRGNRGPQIRGNVLYGAQRLSQLVGDGACQMFHAIHILIQLFPIADWIAKVLPVRKLSTETAFEARPATARTAPFALRSFPLLALRLRGSGRCLHYILFFPLGISPAGSFPAAAAGFRREGRIINPGAP